MCTVQFVYVQFLRVPKKRTSSPIRMKLISALFSRPPVMHIVHCTSVQAKEDADGDVLSVNMTEL